MEIKPHRSVGPFRIGSFLGETIKFLQLHGMTFRDNAITTNIEQPSSADICVSLNDCGIRLRFEPRSQRLHLIDIHDLSKIPLVYDGKRLTGTDASPTFRWIYEVFGPTYPGQYHKKKQVYMLQYPGVCVLFPMTESSASGSFPLELPNGASPVASRIFLHHGPNVNNLSLRSLPGGLEPVCVFIKQGLFFPRRSVFIGFDTSTQACLSDLGPPQQVFPKRDNQMKIHSAADDQAPARDYFFNYFLLGLDLLFDGRVHRVKSIVLHTNSCASRQFTSYRRCNFRIFCAGSLDRARLKAEDKDKGRSLQDEPAKAQAANEGIFQTLRRSEEDMKEQRSKRASEEVLEEESDEDEFQAWGKDATVGPDSSWEAIKAIKGECGRPMLHSKGDNTPFGSTQFFAYDGIIFEVMANGYLDTVTLFIEDEKV